MARIKGTKGSDTLTGTADADRILGLAGDDTISALSGDDYVVGGGGRDDISGGFGNDTLLGGAGDDVIIGGFNEDMIFGGDGDDMLFGQGDPAYGSDRNFDRFDGGAGDDHIMVGEGDRFDGGDGIDTFTLDLLGASEGVIIDATRMVSESVIVIDGVPNTSVEYVDQVLLTDGADRMIGVLAVPGSEGISISGGDGNDQLVDSTGIDTMQGDAGNDRIACGNGHAASGSLDLVYGGAGDDTIRIAADGASAHGGDGEDTIVGGKAKDFAYGDSGADVLIGAGGDDFLVGGDGADILRGDRGSDYSIGGAGSDQFVFTEADLTGQSREDAIGDFTQRQADKIDISAIDADTTTQTNDDFVFIGENAFSHHAGELRSHYDSALAWTLIEGDVDGNGKADFSVRLLSFQVDLQASDFIGVLGAQAMPHFDGHQVLTAIDGLCLV